MATENVGTMIQDVKDETHWPSEDAAIIRHLVSSLRHYRRRRFYFSEKSDSFPTINGVSEYERTTHYPADLLEIDSLRVVSGNGEITCTRLSLTEIRDRQSNSAASRNSPIYYSWYGDKLILFPTPGGVWTVKVDYLFDSTRDETAGTEIDGSDLTMTNEYFRRGSELLRTRIIYALSLGRAEDPTMAIAVKTMNTESDQSLTLETFQRRLGSGFVAARCF